MTELYNLSYKELQALEKQIEIQKQMIEEHKKFLSDTNACAVGYKVTFCVKFNPYAHENDELNDTQEFGDWLVNEPTDLIINHFGLKLPAEDVSGFRIEEMTDEDKEDWGSFWDNEDDN